ncbi:MAG: PAS domain S-box protein [Vulcanimicrobiota bacterium]
MRRTYSRFLAGKLIQACAWLLLALRGRIPDILSAHCGNSLLFIGFAFEGVAMATVYRSDRHWEIVIPSIASLGVLAFFIWAHTPGLYIGISSAVSVLLYGTISVAMIQCSEGSLLSRFVGGAYSLCSIALLIRSAFGFLAPPGFSLNTPHLLQTLVFLPTFMLMLAGGTGFLLILNEQNERQISESEEKYKTLVEKASEAILIAQDERIVYGNSKLSKVLGKPQEQLIGMSLRELVSPRDRDMVLANYHKRLGDDPPQDGYDLRILNAENNELWMILSASRIHWKGNPAIMGLLTEITERKMEEERLYYTQFVIDHMSDAAYWADPDGHLVYVNEAACQKLGYTRDELLTMRVMDIATSFGEEYWVAHWKAIQEAGSLVTENLHQKKNGEVFPVEIHTSLVQFKDKENACGIVRDITERKHQEASILLHNRRLQILLSLAQMKDTEMQAILNQALEYVLQLTRSTVGYIYHYNESEKQFVLNSWSKDVMKECTIIDPQTVYQLDKTGIWGEAVRQQKPIMVNDFQADNPLKKGYPEGHVCLKRFLTVPVFSDGIIVAVIGVGNKIEPYDDMDIVQLELLGESVWSISRMKDDERKIRQYALELKELNATKDRFFSIIAHDLRSPFQGILGLSRLLLEDINDLDRDNIVEHVEMIHNSAKSSFLLLENLLEWSMMQMGKIKFKPENLVFNDVLNEILNLVSGQAQNKNIAIKHYSDVATLVADRNMLASIIRNLLSNAIKFTPPSGTVTIKAQDRKDHIEISITDTGTGMSKEQLKKLFKISETVTEVGTEGEKGSGLGLMLCKEFVEKHGGALTIESEKGKGSSIAFTIPGAGDGL